MTYVSGIGLWWFYFRLWQNHALVAKHPQNEMVGACTWFVQGQAANFTGAGYARLSGLLNVWETTGLVSYYLIYIVILDFSNKLLN